MFKSIVEKYGSGVKILFVNAGYCPDLRLGTPLAVNRSSSPWSSSPGRSCGAGPECGSNQGVNSMPLLHVLDEFSMSGSCKREGEGSSGREGGEGGGLEWNERAKKAEGRGKAEEKSGVGKD